MNASIFVYVDLYGAPLRVGTLWTRARGGRQSATFEYAREWLDSPHGFALEPALTIGPGPHHTSARAAIFGALSDSAPDLWGRALMRRAERRLRVRAEINSQIWALRRAAGKARKQRNIPDISCFRNAAGRDASAAKM